MSPQLRDSTQINSLLINEPVYCVCGARRKRGNKLLPPGALVAICLVERVASGLERVLEEDIGVVVGALKPRSGAVDPGRGFDRVAAWFGGAVEHLHWDVVRDEGAGGGEAG
ncbi:hypothetical protein CNMCM6457_005751 [Aspergillus fumigatiaffinis]|nr:hypothetical protein CNMCM6457_005751 [Aspergillus fumigatiaffinis]